MVSSPNSGNHVQDISFLEGTSSTNISGTKDNACQGMKKDVSSLRYIALSNWFHEAHMESSNNDAQDACNADAPKSSGISNPNATSKDPPAEQMESLTVKSAIPTVSSPVPTACLDNSPETSNDTRLISKGVTSQEETPSLDNILTLSNRHKSKEMEEHSFIATIHQKTTPDLLQFCLFLCFLSQEEPKKIFDALKDPCWVEAMQKELLQFKNQNVWILVDCPKREEGINNEEVFAPVVRIEAIRLFLAYVSFMGFTVYQMDVKSAFLYGTIDEEVYVMQPLRFQDLQFPNRVYKMEKVMYGLHQAPRAWYVLQKKDGIFLSQDKYIGDILKKFRYSDVRSANTPMEKENPWGKDGPVKRIFRYLKGHPKLRLWYPKESPFDLVAYSDSDYGGATQDRKSTTGGCQFLGRRLISWQCKKQTIVATSTTKAEYVAAASGCGQVLWIQNQLLDYGEVSVLSYEYWNA
nr:hypothetical protein [Tanacetum cinerariifolium]